MTVYVALIGWLIHNLGVTYYQYAQAHPHWRTAFNDTFHQMFHAYSLEELFETVDEYNILDFIKESYFYDKL